MSEVKFKLPKVMYICGIKYDIKYVDNPIDSKVMNSRTDDENKVSYIKSKLSYEDTKFFVAYEAQHAAFYRYYYGTTRRELVDLWPEITFEEGINKQEYIDALKGPSPIAREQGWL